MGRNRPRILATNARMRYNIFVHSWSIRGWYLGGAKVNALRELQVKSGEELSVLMPFSLDKAVKGEFGGKRIVREFTNAR